MLGQRTCILVLLCFVGTSTSKFKNVVATARAAPRSKGEPILTRVRSMRHWENSNSRNAGQLHQNHHWENSNRRNEGQLHQNHRRVPKGM